MSKPWLKSLPTSDGGEVIITVTKPSDPAYWLLTDENLHHSKSNLDIYRDDCYICRDPEFAQMGLPLCKPCEVCKVGHVAADDVVCDSCGVDAQELYYSQLAAKCEENGHDWEFSPEKHYSRWVSGFGSGMVTEPAIQASYTSCKRCHFDKDS